MLSEATAFVTESKHPYGYRAFDSSLGMTNALSP